MAIKAVFSDIDGTLLSHSTNTIPNSSLNAIKEMQAHGIKFFLCSGRNFYLMRKTGILNYITPDGVVTMNGSQVIIDGKIIYSYPIKEEVIDMLIKFSKRLKFGLTLIEEKEGHINMIDERVIVAHEKYGTRFPQPRTFPDHYDRTIYQAICFCDEFDESLFIPHLKGCKTARWDEYAVDIMPEDSDKSKGVKATLEYYNLSKDEVLCIGDALNDIEMIEAAGAGVAMGNAKDEVKKVANFVTDDIDNDGFAKAMLHYGLIEKIDNRE